MTAIQLARWEEVFPDMDVLAEARKAREWVLQATDRRKTARGMGKFLYGWLVRAQNRGCFTRRSQRLDSGPPGTRSLFEEYGFESWEQWEQSLRHTFDGAELEVALDRLRDLRRQWERTHG